MSSEFGVKKPRERFPVLVRSEVNYPISNNYKEWTRKMDTGILSLTLTKDSFRLG